MSNERLRDLTVFIFVSMIAIVSFGLVISFMVNKKVVYETFDIIIAFLGLFATVIGAYLGASVAGKKAIETINIERENERKDKISQIQNKLLFNADSLFNIFSIIFNKYGFNNEDAKKLLIQSSEKSRINDLSYNVFFDNLSNFSNKRAIYDIKLSNENKRDIEMYINLLKDMSIDYHHLYIRKKDFKNEKYYINLLVELKQHLNTLNTLIKVINDSTTVITVDYKTKGKILVCFESLIKVNDDLANINIVELMKRIR